MSPIDNDYAQAVGHLNVLREKVRLEFNALPRELRDYEKFRLDNDVISIAVNRLRMNPPQADLEKMDTTTAIAGLKKAVVPKK